VKGEFRAVTPDFAGSTVELPGATARPPGSLAVARGSFAFRVRTFSLVATTRRSSSYRPSRSTRCCQSRDPSRVSEDRGESIELLGLELGEIARFAIPARAAADG